MGVTTAVNLTNSAEPDPVHTGEERRRSQMSTIVSLHITDSTALENVATVPHYTLGERPILACIPSFYVKIILVVYKLSMGLCNTFLKSLYVE